MGSEPAGPSVGQGCLIVIGGMALGFFGCQGWLGGSANVSLGWLLIGVVVVAIGVRRMIVAGINGLRRKQKPGD